MASVSDLLSIIGLEWTELKRHSVEQVAIVHDIGSLEHLLLLRHFNVPVIGSIYKKHSLYD